MAAGAAGGVAEVVGSAGVAGVAGIGVGSSDIFYPFLQPKYPKSLQYEY